LSLLSHTRALLRVRPWARYRTLTAATCGCLVGLGVGGAYLGGTIAKADAVRGQAERLQGAATAGFTEEALVAAAGGLDASALSIARRHDPYSVAGPDQRDRQAELLTARLEQLRQSDPGLRRVRLDAGPAMQPFRLGGALDQSRDLECLTQAVYYEARGEGRAGMQAVAQVVLNRSRHPSFPKTVCGVVYQGSNRSTGCQFSFTCNGAMRGAVNRSAWDRARDVASRALSGHVFSSVGSATHFHTTGVAPAWRNTLVRVAHVGDHYFYRFGGRNGSASASAFAYEARPSGPVASEPRLVQASLDPVAAARQAGEAVAYTMVLAQEGLSAPRPDAQPTAQSQTPARAAEPARRAEPARDAQPAPVRLAPAPATAPVDKVEARAATPAE
jgi:spore germination cell wall hydrolase CwlJ-like protein